jgi:hypothetical protein
MPGALFNPYQMARLITQVDAIAKPTNILLKAIALAKQSYSDEWQLRTLKAAETFVKSKVISRQKFEMSLYDPDTVEERYRQQRLLTSKNSPNAELRSAAEKEVERDLIKTAILAPTLPQELTKLHGGIWKIIVRQYDQLVNRTPIKERYIKSINVVTDNKTGDVYLLNDDEGFLAQAIKLSLPRLKKYAKRHDITLRTLINGLNTGMSLMLGRSQLVGWLPMPPKKQGGGGGKVTAGSPLQYV